MMIVEKRITLKDSKKPLSIIPLGDIHLGAGTTDLTYLRKTVKYIATHPNTYWLGMGDYIDAIMPNDKRFEARCIDKRYTINDISHFIETQTKDMIDIFSPISSKCLGLIEGGHEELISKRYYYDPLREMCRALDTEYLGVSAFIRVYFTPYKHKKDEPRRKHHQIMIWAHHGWFAGRKVGGKINNMVDNAANFRADIYLYGHSHTILTYFKPMMDPGTRGKTIYKKKQLFASTGSFLETYSKGAPNYAERRGFPPQKIGAINIKCYPKKYGVDIHVTE